MENSFQSEAANKKNPKWENLIKREKPLYGRNNDIRSEFARDYTRIIHSNAYRRLKHKTQVFFSPKNDHICTRIEHVNHVESISYTIANYLGLNTELTKSISVAHDLGHAPFGHKGENVLSEISKRDVGIPFWHEKNGLHFVDDIELLEDDERNKQNLNLTYAVRDGIISHCGEINENGLKPRKEAINLIKYNRPNQFAPYTWEACIVKISDNISYIGRDIEDAISIGILNDKKLQELSEILEDGEGKTINNTIVINNLINDLCMNSNPEKGLMFSEHAYHMLKAIKKFNYENIYAAPKLLPSIQYFELVIHQIYETLKQAYDGKNTLKKLKKLEKQYPYVVQSFLGWIDYYWDLTDRRTNYKNRIIYNVSENEKDYYKAIIDYISGMTDNYAIEIYNDIISF